MIALFRYMGWIRNINLLYFIISLVFSFIITLCFAPPHRDCKWYGTFTSFQVNLYQVQYNTLFYCVCYNTNFVLLLVLICNYCDIVILFYYYSIGLENLTWNSFKCILKKRTTLYYDIFGKDLYFLIIIIACF